MNLLGMWLKLTVLSTAEGEGVLFFAFLLHQSNQFLSLSFTENLSFYFIFIYNLITHINLDWSKLMK